MTYSTAASFQYTEVCRGCPSRSSHLRSFRGTRYLGLAFSGAEVLHWIERFHQSDTLCCGRGHTLSHPDLTRLSRAAKENEIASGKKWLEDVTGKTVAMFCYPFGRFDTETKASVAKAGFKGARTTRQFVLAPQPDRFALATTLHAHPMVLRRDNARDFGAYFLSSTGGANRWRGSLGVVTSMLRGWPRFAEALFRRAARDPDAVFHLWGHSWEIEASNMWGQLDSFLRCVSSVAARFETNEEVQQPRH